MLKSSRFTSSNNQTGFTTAEYIVAAVVVLAILAISLFVLGSSSSPQAMVLNKQKYIDKKVSSLNQNNYSQLASELYQDGYITTSLYNTTESLIRSYNAGNFSSNPAYSTFVCVDYIPNKFSYGQVSLNSHGNAATLSINVFTPYSTTSTKYSAGWVLSGSWKLNSVSC